MINWLLLAGVLGAGLGLLLATRPMWGDPQVVADITAEGVVVAPSAVIDIVQLARRAALLRAADTASFEGIVFEPPAPADTFFGALGLDISERDSLPDIAVLRSFRVHPGCELRIERLPRRKLRFAVRGTEAEAEPSALPSRSRALRRPFARGEGPGAREATSGAECLLAVAVRDDPSEGGLPRFFEETWSVKLQESALQFTLSPRQSPLVLDRFLVAGLGFRRGGTLESYIYGGRVSFPTFGKDAMDSLYTGERLALGALEGDVRLVIGDSIRTLYTGTAGEPTILERGSIEPSLLRQLNNENSLLWVLAFGLGAVGLAAAVIQAAR